MKKGESLHETKSAWMGIRKKGQDIDDDLQKNAFDQMEEVKTQKGTF